MAATVSDRAIVTLARRLLVAVAVLFVLYLGVSFALSLFLDPEELASWVEPRLEEALARDVEVGRVDVAFLPLGVRLEEVQVSDPLGMAPELASVGSIELRVALLPLLGRRVEVTRLAVDGLRADLRVGADGRTNFGDLSTAGAAASPDSAAPAPEAEEEARPFRLDLRRIRLTDGALRYASEVDSTTLEVEEIRVRAAVRQDGAGAWTFRGASEGTLTASVGSGLPLLDEAPLGISFDMQADSVFQTLELRTGELRLDRILLTADGRVEQLQDPVRTVAMALTARGIPLEDLVALLPDTLRERFPGTVAGRLATDLSVQGQLGPDRIPDLSGVVRVEEGRVELRGSPLAEALTAELTLNPDRSVMAAVRATALDGPFSLDGGVALGEGGGMDFTVQANPHLSRLPSVLEMPQGFSTAGRVSTRVRITGPLDDPSGVLLDGEVRPREVQLSLPDLAVPVGVAEGVLRLDGQRLVMEDLPVELGPDRLTITGEVLDILAGLNGGGVPQVRAAVEGARLNLTRLSARPIPDSTLTYGKVAIAKVGDRSVGARTPEEAARELGLARPDSLPLAGELTVALDTVIDQTGRMESLQARVEFAPGFLRVPEATFRRYGGEIRTTANLSMTPDASAPFSLALQVRELDAAAFLSETTPLGRAVRGTLTVDLELVGTLDPLLLPDRRSLIGSGSFALTGGGLATVPLTRALATYVGLESLQDPSIDDWQASFILEDGRLRLGEGTLQGAPGSPEVEGSLGLDGTLDLLSIFQLPTERLNTATLERFGVAGEIAANVARRPEVVQAVLRIGGSLVSPEIEADPRAVAQTLGAAVEEEVRSEVQERIDAQRAAAEEVMQQQQAEAQRRLEEQKEQLQQRATGFLRGLLPGRTPPRGDTVRPDTVRPDTVRPDTVRPDTTRPDTVRPDTVRPDTVRPDTVRPDTVRPDTMRPHAVLPDTTRAEPKSARPPGDIA